MPFKAEAVLCRMVLGYVVVIKKANFITAIRDHDLVPLPLHAKCPRLVTPHQYPTYAICLYWSRARLGKLIRSTSNQYSSWEMQHLQFSSLSKRFAITCFQKLIDDISCRLRSVGCVLLMLVPKLLRTSKAFPSQIEIVSVDISLRIIPELASCYLNEVALSKHISKQAKTALSS